MTQTENSTLVQRARTLLSSNVAMQTHFANVAEPDTKSGPGNFALTDDGKSLVRELQAGLCAKEAGEQKEMARHLVTTWAQIYSAMSKLGLVIKETMSTITSGPGVNQEFLKSNDFENIRQAMTAMHIAPTTIGFDPSAKAAPTT